MLSELVQNLKDDYKLKRQVSPRTKYLEDCFAGFKVADITSSEITKYINYRIEYMAANAAINRELAALKRMFNNRREGDSTKG
jgi:site-specific recombinase XerD